MKWLKKLATRKIITLAISATGLGLYFNPVAIELLIEVFNALGQ